VGAVIFVVTLLSAILSTIDSALLAPATVLSLNVAPGLGLGSRGTALGRTRYAVMLVALLSMAAAFAGESAYSLLESTYELGMVSLLAPMCLALFYPRRSERAILTSMACGTGAWLGHLLSGAECLFGLDALGVPMGLGCMGLSVAGYFAAVERR